MTIKSYDAPLILSIDLGGTKILTAVIRPDGSMVAREHTTVTPASKGPGAVVDAILESSHRSLDRAGLGVHDLAGIGLAAPGLVNRVEGTVMLSPNLPGWKDVPVQRMVEEHLGRPTILIHDGKAAALGELLFGAARGARNCICITLGTGIGGGIVINGSVYQGAVGLAGEVGHMTILDNGPPCYCGNRGCWESLASGTAIAREAKRLARERPDTSVLRVVGGDIDRITAATVQTAAASGDCLAQEVIARAAYYLGVGLSNLAFIFNPERIVIGGGLANIGDPLLRPATETAELRTFPPTYQALTIVRAALGRNSVAIGAAAFALSEIRRRPKPAMPETASGPGGSNRAGRSK